MGRKHRKWRALRRGIRAAVLPAILDGAAVLSRRRPDLLRRALPRLATPWLRSALSVVRQNLALAFGPNLSVETREHLVRAHMGHLGATLAEWLWMIDHDGLPGRVLVENRHHIEEAFRLGTGVVAVSAHLGNWELLARSMTLDGYAPVVIARKVHDATSEGLVDRIRRRGGVQVAGRDDSPRALLRILRRGGAIAILADQDTKVSGIMAPFFGHPAFTPTAPANLARAAGAAILPVFIRRESPGVHRVIPHPPFLLDPDAPKDTEVDRVTSMLNGIIERAVRETPAQWAWVHRRWRVRYAGSGGDRWREHAARRAPGRTEDMPAPIPIEPAGCAS